MNLSIKRKQCKIFLKNISTRTPRTIIHMPHDFISFYAKICLKFELNKDYPKLDAVG